MHIVLLLSCACRIKQRRDVGYVQSAGYVPMPVYLQCATDK